MIPKKDPIPRDFQVPANFHPLASLTKSPEPKEGLHPEMNRIDHSKGNLMVTLGVKTLRREAIDFLVRIIFQSHGLKATSAQRREITLLAENMPQALFAKAKTQNHFPGKAIVI